MENVVEFPTKTVRDWALIERDMRASFASAGFSREVQNRLVDVMKSFWQLLNFPFNFSIPDLVIEIPVPVPSKDQITVISSAIAQKVGELSSEQLQDFTAKLMAERVSREISICRELGLL
jgi:hypothetical protein